MPASRKPPFSAYSGDEPYLFVSYAHEDADWVYAELEWLRERGVRLWYDEGIEAGATWTDELAQAIEGCRGLLFFASPASVISRHATNEVLFAIDAGKPLLAVHFEETALPPGLRLVLGSQQAVIQGDLSLAGYRRKLLNAVAALSGAPRPADVDVSEPVPGFRGRAAIAVLPFGELGAGDEGAYFAQGLTEELVVGLQAWRTLPVISRQSTETYGPGEVDVRRLARELGVGYVLRGSVRRSGERLRITAQLLDARTGVQLWASRFDGSLADVFELQDRLTLEIMGAIEPQVLEEEKDRSTRVPTGDLAAWDLYLRGQAHFEKATYDDFLRARDYWHEALRLDPELPHVLAGLAGVEMYLLLHHRGRLSEEEADHARVEGHRLAAEAVRIDPRYFPGQMALVVFLIHEGEYERAVELANRAVEMCPGSSQTHRNLGYALFRAGRFEDALEEFAVAKRLSPQDPMMWEILNQEGACHFFLTRYAEALEHAENAIELSPSVLWPHLFRTFSLSMLGRADEAKGALRQFLEDVPDFSADQLAELDPQLAEPFFQGLRDVGWEG